MWFLQCGKESGTSVQELEKSQNIHEINTEQIAFSELNFSSVAI